MNPRSILKQYWGFDNFKPLQEEIINSVLNRKDVIALLPTGGGKSLCYQIPGITLDGICIVLSPLIALMNDQISQLKKKGIKAISINSALKKSDIDRELDNCVHGHYKFLYLAPERLKQGLIIERIKQMQINLIAVDEAHCISQWGHDFRPSYRHISILKDICPDPPFIALTATARPQVIEDISKTLELKNPKLYKGNYIRRNIVLKVIETKDKLRALYNIIRPQESVIIYVNSRNFSVAVSNFLNEKKISSTHYHGGLSAKEKQNSYEEWIKDKKYVMVSTSAFGMGIDKANVRMIIHMNLPENLERYYQEIGRAGRDNNPASAVLLKSVGDDATIKKNHQKNTPSVDDVKIIYKKLCNYFQISYGQQSIKLQPLNFSEFCQIYNFGKIKTYNTLKLLDQNGIIKFTTDFTNDLKLKIIVSGNIILEYCKSNPNESILIKSILRTYEGIFERPVKVEIGAMSIQTQLNKTQIRSILVGLEKNNYIEIHNANADAEIIFTEPREDDKTINRISKIIENSNRIKTKNIEHVLDYSNNNDLCKVRQIINYFGEKIESDCGQCSVCVKSKQTFPSDVNIALILKALKIKSMDSRSLSKITNLEAKIVIEVLNLLLDSKKISITKQNTYQIIE